MAESVFEPMGGGAVLVTTLAADVDEHGVELQLPGFRIELRNQASITAVLNQLALADDVIGTRSPGKVIALRARLASGTDRVTLAAL
jgi:hypothetical protein